MARQDSTSEMQHVVPKAALLNNFAFLKSNRKSRHVYLFDRIKGKQINGEPSVNNVLGQRNFYSDKLGDSIYSIEQGLADLEDIAAPIISDIISDASLVDISNEHRACLSTFVAAQWLRSPKVRDSQKILSETIARKSRSIAPNATNLQEIEALARKEGVKLASIRQISESVENFSEMIFSYRWLLQSAPKGQGFWVSDSPVVMHNDRDFGPYSNVGFGVSGVQITMPLSAEIALSIWHPKVVKDLIEVREERLKSQRQLSATRLLNLKIDRNQVDVLSEKNEQELNSLDALLDSLDKGDAIAVTADIMDHFNSLQYRWSHRFIASKSNDFSLAKKMFANNPNDCVEFRAD